MTQLYGFIGELEQKVLTHSRCSDMYAVLQQKNDPTINYFCAYHYNRWVEQGSKTRLWPQVDCNLLIATLYQAPIMCTCYAKYFKIYYLTSFSLHLYEANITGAILQIKKRKLRKWNRFPRVTELISGTAGTRIVLDMWASHLLTVQAEEALSTCTHTETYLILFQNVPHFHSGLRGLRRRWQNSKNSCPRC